MVPWSSLLRHHRLQLILHIGDHSDTCIPQSDQPVTPTPPTMSHCSHINVRVSPEATNHNVDTHYHNAHNLLDTSQPAVSWCVMCGPSGAKHASLVAWVYVREHLRNAYSPPPAVHPIACIRHDPSTSFNAADRRLAYCL